MVSDLMVRKKPKSKTFPGIIKNKLKKLKDEYWDLGGLVEY